MTQQIVIRSLLPLGTLPQGFSWFLGVDLVLGGVSNPGEGSVLALGEVSPLREVLLVAMRRQALDVRLWRSGCRERLGRPGCGDRTAEARLQRASLVLSSRSSPAEREPW